MIDLTICSGCSRSFVYPVEWYESDPLNWHVTMRCGNCGAVSEGVFDQATVDAFDERLDEGTESLVFGLRRMLLDNLAGEADRFAAALNAGAILPEDF